MRIFFQNNELITTPPLSLVETFLVFPLMMHNTAALEVASGLCPNLSPIFFNVLTEVDVTTETGRLFQYFTTVKEKVTLSSNDVLP